MGGWDYEEKSRKARELPVILSKAKDLITVAPIESLLLFRRDKVFRFAQDDNDNTVARRALRSSNYGLYSAIGKVLVNNCMV
jgi:hypothetical protein